MRGVSGCASYVCGSGSSGLCWPRGQGPGGSLELSGASCVHSNRSCLTSVTLAETPAPPGTPVLWAGRLCPGSRVRSGPTTPRAACVSPHFPVLARSPGSTWPLRRGDRSACHQGPASCLPRLCPPLTLPLPLGSVPLRGIDPQRSAGSSESEGLGLSRGRRGPRVWCGFGREPVSVGTGSGGLLSALRSGIRRRPSLLPAAQRVVLSPVEGSSGRNQWETVGVVFFSPLAGVGSGGVGGGSRRR